jgi:rare lipoprotein A
MRQHQFGCLFGVTARRSAFAALALTLANCSSGIDSKYGVRSSQRVVGPGQAVPKGGGTYRVGDPYVIAGRTYVPREDSKYRAEGQASWYGADFQGRLTANGEVFDMQSLSAAHPTLPLPTYVRVTNLENRRSIVVRVNDRGPFHNNRVIDVSVRAAKLLGFYDKGTAQVRVDYVGRAALGGSDDEKLAASLRIEEPVSPLVQVAKSVPAAPAPQAPTAGFSLMSAYAATPEHGAALLGRGLY